MDISYCAVGSYVVMWLWNVAILWKEYLKLKINLAIWRKHYNFAVGLHKIWKQNKKNIHIIYNICTEQTLVESFDSLTPART